MKILNGKTILSLSLSLFTLLASAQSGEEAKPKTKTGFNFGPLPAIGYSTDSGFHYGVLSDIYYYGDGSKYPEYLYKFNVEASAYTKGNMVFHGFFDSKYLVPGLRVSAAVTYLGNNTYSFYGFNGASANYINELDRISADGIGFYLMKRHIFRVMTGVQGKFGDSHWGWAGGLSYYSFNAGHAKNKGLKTEKSLYDLYLENDIIPSDEKDGGKHFELKAGVVFDTRDHENNPSRGTNIEMYVFGSPDIFQKRNHYMKLAVHFKQFFPLNQDKIVFGYHLAYQGRILGRAPFYSLQTIQSLNMKQINSEGLGSTSTVRGTVANRFTGDGYAWSNFELRFKVVRFDWIKQHWTIAVNPFFDAGMIVQPYRFDQMKKAAENPVNAAPLSYEKDGNPVSLALKDGSTPAIKDLMYTGKNETIHMGAGFGIHVIMNENFNISFEFAKPFKKQDGLFGMNVGLNYIF